MAGSPAVLSPVEEEARLSAFFAQGLVTLDAFCESHCQPRRQKKALFTLFFRGSFARTEASAPVDVNAAYA
ncbi:MAG: hypothetical protein REI12_13750, partial [Pedobacter sp.]|nr:hypothetical protein [Pedobacter sp.]